MTGNDLDEEYMPNYHEMDDETDFPRPEDDDYLQGKDKTSLDGHSKLRNSKPPSTERAVLPSIAHDEDPASLESHQDPNTRGIPIRLNSTTPLDTSLEHHSCPVCGKQMVTDNRGLNAHIDFCLSKGAILAAQTTTNRPGRRRASTTATTKRK